MKTEMDMKKQIFYRILIIGSLIFNIVFIGMWMAHAVPRHFMKYCRCGSSENAHHACAMQKALSMSDSQWTLLKPGVESFREKNFHLCREIGKNRAALMDELERTPVDSAALFACKGRIVACQGNMQDLVTSHILGEKEKLTPDQRRRYFAALRNNMSCAGVPGMMGMTPFEKGKRAATCNQ
jgi:hypothetical protein